MRSPARPLHPFGAVRKGGRKRSLARPLCGNDANLGWGKRFFASQSKSSKRAALQIAREITMRATARDLGFGEKENPIDGVGKLTGSVWRPVDELLIRPDGDRAGSSRSLSAAEDEEHPATSVEREFKVQALRAKETGQSGFKDLSLEELTDDQQVAADAVLGRRENAFLTGPAGTGKSFLFRYIVQQCIKRFGEGRVGVTATTGVAAVNIGGQTLHSWAGIGLGRGCVNTLVDRVRDNFYAKLRWKQSVIMRRCAVQGCASTYGVAPLN